MATKDKKRKTKPAVKPTLIFDDNNDEKDTTVILRDINVSTLTKTYNLTTEQKTGFSKRQEVIPLTNGTTLEQLGLAMHQQEPDEIIVWGEKYKTKLFIGKNLLDPRCQLKCYWCHDCPRIGSLMLAVPFNYVPPSLKDNVYSPDSINSVTSLKVNKDPKIFVTSQQLSAAGKNAIKIKSTLFQESLSLDRAKQLKGDERLDEEKYFECMKPVCSFACMLALGKKLSRTDFRFRNVESHIAHMYYCYFGKLPDNLREADPIDVINEYGGKLSRDEYRENLGKENLQLNAGNLHWVGQWMKTAQEIIMKST